MAKYFFSLSLSRESPQGLVRLTLIYSPFSISFDDFGTRFLFASQWGTRRGLFLSVAFLWDNDWNETLFPVLTFGIWCKSVCLFSVLKQTINQQLEALGLQLLLDRLRGQELVFRGMSYKKEQKEFKCWNFCGLIVSFFLQGDELLSQLWSQWTYVKRRH